MEAGNAMFEFYTALFDKVSSDLDIFVVISAAEILHESCIT